MRRLAPWLVLALVVILALIGKHLDSGKLAKLEASRDSLASIDAALVRELEESRRREQVLQARAESAEAEHATSKETVRVVSDTTLVIAGVSGELVVPRPVVARIQTADIAADRWKALADQRAVVIARQDSLLEVRVSEIAVRDTMIAKLRPRWTDRVGVSVVLTPQGVNAGLSVELANLRDLGGLLLRRRTTGSR